MYLQFSYFTENWHDAAMSLYWISALFGVAGNSLSLYVMNANNVEHVLQPNLLTFFKQLKSGLH